MRQVGLALLAALVLAAPAAAEPDAQKRLDEALAAAKASDRKVLVHVHGPG